MIRSRALTRLVVRARTLRAHEPPTCPPGWRTGPPDFVGVGVQKSGTSWWYSLITRHPSVHHLRGTWKELHFFDRFHDRVPSPEEQEFWYRCFPRPPGGLAGEWTPVYMSHFWTARLLAQAAPETQILVLLRDPVERFRSALTHELAHGRDLDAAATREAFRRGLYGSQLERLIALFGRERILVLQYERCRTEAAGELARTYAFLGLPPVSLPRDAFAEPVNETRVPKVDLPAGHREALAAAYRDEVALVSRLVPDLDRSLWPNFAC